MNGKSDLKILLGEMEPELQSGEYVFVAVKGLKKIAEKDIIGQFREKEGTSVIIERQIADQLGLPYDCVTSWITLTVHSSLGAVGFTAAFSAALAARGIGCNVIAAYHHDHIFVGKADAPNALQALRELSASHQ